MARRFSLLHADPVLFSPIHLNVDSVSTEKLLALYRFANIFFPDVGSGLVNMILDMERHSERLTAHSSPEEREKLISQMEDLSVDIQFTVSNKGISVMEVSIHIVPDEVLRRAQQGRSDLMDYQKISDDLGKSLVKLIAKEVSRRFTVKVADRLKALSGFAQVPALITQLRDLGWINRGGELQQGASIDDLLSGKYREQFEQLMPNTILQEGLHIRETIETFFVVGQQDTEYSADVVRERHALLEITIREATKHRDA